VIDTQLSTTAAHNRRRSHFSLPGKDGDESKDRE